MKDHTQRLLLACLILIMSVLAGCSPASAIDPDDVTPGAQNGAALNGVWYGDLDIIRYDYQTGQPSPQIVEAFYLDLTLRTDQTIIGTYTTCTKDKPVTIQGLDKYDINYGKLEQGGIIYLDVFTVMHGSLSGNAMKLSGMRYKPHSDAILDNYSAVLQKVARSSFLSACHIISGQTSAAEISLIV